MITLFDVLRHNGIDPASVRLVRHGNKTINILDSFVTDIDRFEAYQSFQKKNRFGDAKYICVFCPARGTTAMFLGLWDIKRHIYNKDFPRRIYGTVRRLSLPKKWLESSSWYDLKRNPILDDYSQRLVIEWGKSTVAWVQSKDKPIIEIKAPNAIGEFVSYDDIQLSFRDIKKLSASPDSNATWVNALSAVNGIYLIRDTSIGKLYVGAAYGKDGIWGRWLTYAKTGHGGNEQLKPLDPDNFEFSVLEIIPPNYSADDVIERERRWMTRLGSCQHGLNS